MKEYTLYKGEELLAIGTIPYIARVMGVQRNTMTYYRTQAYKNKLAKRINSTNARILILLDDEEEEI
ncbi:hypothetical protein AAK964_10430 [Tissierella praeacuta]|uniref:hypothetical protein n=1 Tax=Tissierella praeacuta TaxID=43131 RepID=UPI003519326A